MVYDAEMQSKRVHRPLIPDEVVARLQAIDTSTEPFVSKLPPDPPRPPKPPRPLTPSQVFRYRKNAGSPRAQRRKPDEMGCPKIRPYNRNFLPLSFTPEDADRSGWPDDRRARLISKFHLSRRQRQLLILTRAGLRMAEIAYTLGIHENTLLRYSDTLRKKLGYRHPDRATSIHAKHMQWWMYLQLNPALTLIPRRTSRGSHTWWRKSNEGKTIVLTGRKRVARHNSEK